MPSRTGTAGYSEDSTTAIATSWCLPGPTMSTRCGSPSLGLTVADNPLVQGFARVVRELTAYP